MKNQEKGQEWRTLLQSLIAHNSTAAAAEPPAKKCRPQKRRTPRKRVPMRDKLEQVHALLKKHGELSRPQVAELMGTSYTCAHRWLSMLADQGRVRRCGHPRMPIWTPR